MNYKKSIEEYLHELKQRDVIFYLKKGQLKYKDSNGYLTASHLNELRTRKQEIIGFLNQLASSEVESQQEILPILKNKPSPLSFSQQRLWFLDRYQSGNSSHYNIPLAFKIEGGLCIPSLELAFNRLIERHESLRTCIKEDDEGVPYQEILPSNEVLPLVLEVADGVDELNIKNHLANMALEPFDLSEGPLLRVKLFSLDKEFILFVNQHHIISDAWSLNLFFEELSQFYNTYIKGENAELSNLEIQYADFSVWQRQYLQGDVLSKSLDYWRDSLTDYKDLALVTDRPRPAVQTFRGQKVEFSLDYDLSEKLNTLAVKTNSTLYIVLLAGFYLLLHRYSGQDDIVVGTPIANRFQKQLEGIIGFFVNSLPIRLSIDRKSSIESLIDTLRTVCLSAYEYQDIPFEKLLEEVGVDRDQRYSPLFQTMFVLQNATNEKALNLLETEVSSFSFDYPIAKFDLTLALIEQGGLISGMFEYNSDLYDRDTVKRMIDHYKAYLFEMVENPPQSLAEINVNHLPEYQKSIYEWNKTEACYPDQKQIHQLFEEQVENASEHIAVEFNNEKVTYRQLNDRANQLANLLVSQGAEGGYVAVILERSVHMLVAVLATLKAGAAYVPIDPSFPKIRMQSILSRLKINCVLTQYSATPPLRELQWQLPTLRNIILMDVITRRPQPESLNTEEVADFWDYISESAVDEVTAGGFISAYTGQAFNQKQVEEYENHAFSLIEPYLDKTKKVLEIGCGSGTIMYRAAPKVNSYVGLDPSPVTQNKNKKHIEMHSIENISLLTGYADELHTIESNSYDVVVIASTVQFFPGYFYLESVIEEALRLLMPKGVIVFIDLFDPDKKTAFITSVEDFAKQYKDKGESINPKVHFDSELYVHPNYFYNLKASLENIADIQLVCRDDQFTTELKYRYDLILSKKGSGINEVESKRVSEDSKKLLTVHHIKNMPITKPVIHHDSKAIAYVIHTSGSTGEPKGVVVTHKTVVNLIDWVNKQFEVSAEDKILFITSLCFDLSVYDIFGILAAGGCVRIASESEIKSPESLVEIIANEGITFWDSAPAALLQLTHFFPTNRHLLDGHNSLRLVFLSGDWIPLNLPDILKSTFPGASVIGLGGATEASIWSNYYPIGAIDSFWTSIPYGKPIQNAKYYVLDDQSQPCPIGVPGNLYIGGLCLALGYTDHKLTEERFIDNPFCLGERIYTTGDLARWKADGNLEFLGRNDTQVKVNGYRIELGEIEHVLSQHEAVEHRLVRVCQVNGSNQLCAYYTVYHGKSVQVERLKCHLSERLPAYMLPKYFIELEIFPVNANGKLDYNSLPLPDISLLIGSGYLAPSDQIERELAEIWCSILGVDSVGVEHNFFDVGGDSLRAVRLQAQMNKKFSTKIKVIDIFTYPTIKALASYLSDDKYEADNHLVADSHDVLSGEPIAIIGYSGAFSGCNSVDEFWEKLLNGEESVSHLTQEECAKLGVSDELIKQNNYIASMGLLDERACFDSGFWGMSPRESELLDPQTRRFIEHSWHALEKSGYAQARHQLTIGLFAGAGNIGYLTKNIMSNQGDEQPLFESYLLGNKDFMASRVAYHLNLKGPVLNLYTACSTSLVSVIEACKELSSQNCDMALAGGITLQLPEQFGYAYEEGGISSKDGHCRTFDSAASGTVSGSGVGVVVLKRLSAAQRDNDTILSVIRGYGLNNDGNQKVGYTAPSVQGQRDCILAAQHMAGLSSNEIDYVETHGTATELGDSIEIKALNEAFQSNSQGEREWPCVLGAVKANVGHTDAAAGMAGLLKVCKMLESKVIPPQIHFDELNPHLAFDKVPFAIQAEPKVWDATASPRRAGVSSFGIGGTNTHIILEEAPERKLSEPLLENHSHHLLTLSAKTEASLQSIKAKLAKYLEAHPEALLSDIVYTLNARREAFSYRYALICDDEKQVIDTLQEEEKNNFLNLDENTSSDIVFLCSGIGEHYSNMGKGLYEGEQLYRDIVNQCCEIASQELGVDFLRVLYPLVEVDAGSFNQTSYLHAAVFITSYAMSKLLMSWGIHPKELIGHSVGEYLAACLAGVFDLETALTTVIKRAQIIQKLPAGGMMALPLPIGLVEEYLSEDIALAAVNGPSLCVVSGRQDKLDKLSKKLLEEGLVSIKLPVTHAFHSPMMCEARGLLLELFSSIDYQSPKINYISNLTGQAITVSEVKDPDYWYRHTCETVQFSQGIKTLLEKTNSIFVEVGPGANLTSALLQHQNKKLSLKNRVVNTIKNLKQQDDCDDVEFFLESIKALWQQGVVLDWSKIYDSESHRVVTDLPGYAFSESHYWLSPKQEERNNPICDKRLPIDKWFYEPVWKQSAALSHQTLDTARCYLIFCDKHGIGEALGNKLKSYGAKVYHVYFGDEFLFDEINKRCTLSLANKNDYQQLLAQLNKLSITIDEVIHAPLIDSLKNKGILDLTSIKHYQTVGFDSLLYLTQAITARSQLVNLKLTVLGGGLYSVYGNETLEPEKSVMQGLLKCIPQEYPEIRCSCIDMSLEDNGNELIEQLTREIMANASEVEVAYRKNRRWVKHYQQLAKPEKPLLNLLKNQGVYLITGGLGNIGLLLAEYLAKNHQAKLVLMSRNSGSSVHDEQLKKLESYGAEVLVLKGDVTSQVAINAVINRAKVKYGKLNGVFHFAGAIKESDLTSIDSMSEDYSSRQFKTKVDALHYIDQAIKSEEVDFCVLAGSLSPILGGIYFSAYAGASAFMDQFIDYQEQKQTRTHWLSINMDGWDFANDLTSFDIKPEEAELYFSSYFNHFLRAGQVITSTCNLDSRIKRWVAFDDQLGSLEANEQKIQLHSRPEVKTDYVSAETDLEKQLVEIWRNILGIDEIGIHDCFFDLGGNSLTGTYLISKIRQALSLNLSVKIIFENRTIKELSEVILKEGKTEDTTTVIEID
jgi:polyketide synthase PksJ